MTGMVEDIVNPRVPLTSVTESGERSLEGVSWGVAAAQRDETRRPPVPVDPVSLILEALKAHAIVSFSDSHGYPELADFEQSVIRDARIRAATNDVVIENGNAAFQPVMDRYVGGEQVSYEELRHVWQDTTQIQTIGPRAGAAPLTVVADRSKSTSSGSRQLGRCPARRWCAARRSARWTSRNSSRHRRNAPRSSTARSSRCRASNGKASGWKSSSTRC
jgi:hypothetical protein